MGFVPSGHWKHYASVPQYLGTIRVSPVAFDRLYREFQTLLVVAADRTPDDGTEVAGLGLGNNTSGLLFSHGAAARPRVGQQLPDGRRYTDAGATEAGHLLF